MPVVPITGYVRNKHGQGIGDALVEVFAITNLAANTKGASPLATTYPDSQTGRYTLSVNTDNSPTGYVSTRITRGNTVRWVEGDAQFQVARFYAQHGIAPLTDNSVTDNHIGTRTVNQGVTPTASGTLIHLINGLANRIRAITGESSWLTNPVMTIREIRDKFNASGTLAHNHTGVSGMGPKLNPNEALTYVPAAANHNHDDRYELKGASSGGGSVDQADNALNLRNQDGRRFLYMAANRIPNYVTTAGPHRMQLGTDVVTTNSSGAATINYPQAFPSQTRWIIATNGDSNAYRGEIAPTHSNNTGFQIRIQGNEARQVRVNWIAIGD